MTSSSWGVYDTHNKEYTADPNDLLLRLRVFIDQLRTVPAPREASPRTFVFKDLKHCTHVFLQS